MQQSNAIKTILLAGFVAGTCDILGAIIVYSFIMERLGSVQILHSIASGIFGKAAYEGGTQMAVLGLAFHYIIATIFAAGYFLIFPYVPFLRKQKILAGLLYGIIVWCIMNLVVVPMSHVGSAPFKVTINTFRGMAILMVCIGLPISLIVHRYYISKKNYKV